MANIIITQEDDRRTDKAAVGLIAELSRLSYVHGVARPAAPVAGAPLPPGEPRSADLIALGTVLATLAFTPEIIGGFLSYLGEWAHRPGRGRKAPRLEVTIEGKTIVLDNPSPEERAKIVAAWLKSLEAAPASRRRR